MNISTANYSFTINGLSGFYRLRLVDSNEDFTYSDILHIAINPVDFSIYPNPAQNEIRWNNGNGLGTYNYTIYSSTGALALQGSTETSNVNISNLSQGQYFIDIQSSSNQITRTSFIIHRK